MVKKAPYRASSEGYLFLGGVRYHFWEFTLTKPSIWVFFGLQCWINEISIKRMKHMNRKLELSDQTNEIIA